MKRAPIPTKGGRPFSRLVTKASAHHCRSRYQSIPPTAAISRISLTRRINRKRIGGRLSFAGLPRWRIPRIVAIATGGFRADPSEPPEPK